MPPRLAIAWLRWLLPPPLAAEVERDLRENFAHRLAGGASIRAARRWFWRQVLSRQLVALRWETRKASRTRRRAPLAGPGSDLRATARGARRHPLFAVLVVGVVALGFATTTGLVAVVDTVLLQPLPYADPDRLVVFWKDESATGGSDEMSWSRREYGGFVHHLRDMGQVEAQFGYPVTVHVGAPRSVRGARVTGGFLSLYGTPPMLGRPIVSGDRDVVVLSHRAWQQWFDRRAVIGETMRIEDLNPLAVPTAGTSGGEYTIVGIMPPEFFSASNLSAPHTDTDVWIPFLDAEAVPRANTRVLDVVMRLRSGVTRNDVDIAGMRAFEETARAGPATDAPVAMRVLTIGEQLGTDSRPPLRVMAAAALLLAAVVVANAGNLFVVRGAIRAGELAIRGALGAAAWQRFRLVAVEAATLTGAGALAGMVLATATTPWLAQSIPLNLPRLAATRVYPSHLAIGMGLAVVVALVFAGLAWIGACRAAPHLVRQRQLGSRSSARLQFGSILVQTAIAATLFVVSGMALQSLRHATAIQPEFETDRRLTFSLRLSQTAYPTDADKIGAVESLHRTIGRVPGVLASGSSDQVPPERGGSGGHLVSAVAPEGHFVSLRTVSRDYLASLGVSPYAGRDFNGGDRYDTELVALMSTAAAARLFPGIDPIGRHVWYRGDTTTLRIVGLVPDLVTYRPDGAPHLEIYQLNAQRPWGQHRVVVHLDRDPLAALPEITAAVRRVDPDLPLESPATMRERIDTALAMPRFLGFALSAYAAAAILLSAVGIFGVFTYLVTQRMREAALRMALGAAPDQVSRHFLAPLLRLVAVGNVVAVLLGLGAGRVIGSQLHGVGGPHPGLFGAALAATFGLAYLASAPARRRIRGADPTAVLNVD